MQHGHNPAETRVQDALLFYQAMTGGDDGER